MLDDFLKDIELLKAITKKNEYNDVITTYVIDRVLKGAITEKNVNRIIGGETFGNTAEISLLTKEKLDLNSTIRVKGNKGTIKLISSGEDFNAPSIAEVVKDYISYKCERVDDYDSN